LSRIRSTVQQPHCLDDERVNIWGVRITRQVIYYLFGRNNLHAVDEEASEH